MLKWIDPKKRLPKQGDRVLICLEGVFVCEAWLDNSKKWIRISVEVEKWYGTSNVTGWMPMPKGTAHEENEKSTEK